MDEHRLRLRYENGLSTSLGENPVRRLNKRVRQLIVCNSSQEKGEAVSGLLRDQSALRDIVLVQQLRHRKLSRVDLKDTTERLNEEKQRLETKLREKTALYAGLSAKLPRSQSKSDSSKHSLRPVSVCQAEIAEIEKQETELNEKIYSQLEDLKKWKELGKVIEDFLSAEVTMRGGEGSTDPIDSTGEELEPKIKK